MRWTELPPGDPAVLLAWEEALLRDVDAGADPTLWFWESPSVFVVIGYGQSLEREVLSVPCATLRIPVLRRTSGGGAVVQGPGCLNYGVALRLHEHSELATVTQTNQFVMERQAAGMNPLLNGGVTVEGFTDLALRGPDGIRRKFSGNSQRRLRNALMFHGTFLCHFDLSWISTLLPLPEARPAYRADRPHEQFVVNLGISPDRIRAALRAVWRANDPLLDWPKTIHDALLAERYHHPEWHLQRAVRPQSNSDNKLETNLLQGSRPPATDISKPGFG